MIPTGFWRSTVTQLLGVFRRALCSLIPSVTDARIPWRDDEAYDDWDEIAEVLYRNIVVRTLQHAEECGEGVELPPFDTVIQCYADVDVIEVFNKSHNSDGPLVFVGLSTRDQPFDTVKAVVVSKDLDVRDSTLHYVPLSSCTFGLLRRGTKGERKEVFEIGVEL